MMVDKPSTYNDHEVILLFNEYLFIVFSHALASDNGFC